jgi:adenosylmethionine---8-amino-7-oxononanoate aminotransferase
MSLSSRDLQSVWHPYTQMKNAGPPLAIVRGEGAYLFDDKGKKYIDAISSWWVNLHGHAHPYIAQKVFEQLQTLEHVIFAGFTHEPAVRLAERLLEILPANQEKIFYSDNGSTAVEVALKLAIQFWHNKGYKKNKILVFEHSYHGDTFGSMSVSARGAFTDAFSSMLFDVITVPFPTEKTGLETIAVLKKIISAEKENIAAFIFEPLVLGAGGMLMYEAELLDKLLDMCRSAGILTIADEVMTGFGRTGKLFASGYLNSEPDIICLSKGITGGTMALGATSCSGEVFNAFYSEDKAMTFFHGHSYTANPVACAAALASMDLLLQDTCTENIERISEQHAQFAKELKKNPAVEKVRVQGTILAFDVISAEHTSYFNNLRDGLYDHFLEEGILLRPLGNTLYLMPPYCISNQDLAVIYQSIEKKLCAGIR